MFKNIKIQLINDLARRAGKVIMSYYQLNDINIDYKADNSPVTSADIASNQLICDELTKLHPFIPIISEENDNNQIINQQCFWSIDPLDGTKGFLSRNGEFTVNIALIVNSSPILGIVYSPLHDTLYYVDEDKIAYKQIKDAPPIPIKARSTPTSGAIILTSALSTNQARLNTYIQDKHVDKIIPTASALKICLIAEGIADLYPRFGQTMEWDTAAGHAILKAAGGNIKTLDNTELSYGHNELKYYNPEFIAHGKE